MVPDRLPPTSLMPRERIYTTNVLPDRRNTRIRSALAAWIGLGLGLGLGCEGTNEPDADAPAAAPSAQDPPPPSPPPPPPPGAFELPGLRERAPKLRFGWPTESVHLTSSFGWRVDPVSGLGTRLHRGIDLRGSIGDLVLSIGPGTVEFVGQDPLLGNLVIVDHGDGLRSLYGHLSDVLVVSDVPVDRGAAIGLVGNTGRSAAPHLHLTVTLDGQAIDPLEILGEPPHPPRALVVPLDAAAPSEAAPSTPAPAASQTTTPEDPPTATAAPVPQPPRGPGSHPLPHRSDDGGAR